MYIDKQVLYESFLSRGFDDACARLMAGLDPATVMEAKDPYEEAQKRIEKKKKEIEGEYNQKTRPFKEKVNELKRTINSEYEELDKIIKNYRNDSGKSNDKNGTGGSSATHEPEEGYTADSPKTKGSDEHIENIANNWGNYSKEEKEEITKSMSEDDRNNLVLALTDIDRIGETHPEALESVNFLGETILPDEEWFNKNKNNDTSSKQENPEQKKQDEQSKEAQEGDKQKQQNAETQQASGSGEKKGTDVAQKERDARNGSEGSAPNNAEPNTDKQSGSGNQNETDKSTTSETEEGYNVGSSNSENGSTEQKPHGNSNQGESGNQSNTNKQNTEKGKKQSEEVFPPADYKIGNGKTVGELVKDIKANTYELLQNAVEIAKVEAWSLWRIREVALLQDHATKEALEDEMKNYNEVSERVIYQLMFGSDGRGTRLDVFRIKQFRDIN